jgi:hypothetical protein
VDLEPPDPRGQVLGEDRHLVADGKGASPEGSGHDGAKASDREDAVNRKSEDSVRASWMGCGREAGEGVSEFSEALAIDGGDRDDRRILEECPRQEGPDLL